MWDSEKRYGLISRILHWGLAALIIWQAVGGIGRWIYGPFSLFNGILFQSHVEIGTAIFVALVARCIWRGANVLRATSYQSQKPFSVATLGHLAIYFCMICVVGCGALQIWGRGRALELFGVTVLPNFTPPQELRNLARTAWEFHPYFACALAFLIVGHIVMACVHQWVKRDGTMNKMI